MDVVHGAQAVPRFALKIFLAVTVLLMPLPAAFAAGDNAYLQALEAKAHGLKLSHSRYWHLLLHYQDNLIAPGVTSTITSPWFFNAPRGRTRPKAELDATLKAFFSAKPLQPRDEPARCVFIARYTWLDSKLHFDEKRLPQPPCKAFHQWMSRLDPKSVSVVFPNAYMNSPASMFGHTLLRIDAKGQTRGTRLLAYAVNYAANTEEDNGLVFAVKGIFGGYPGTFGLFPYYKKVKQYSRIENRDIWSYRLNFDHAEIQRMLRHLWELKGAKSPYYFFTRNCSYELLTLLETGRPGLRLNREFPAWVIPTDTLRVLRSQPGLISRVEYRPSRQTVLTAHYDQLTAQDQALAVALGIGSLQPDAARAARRPAMQRARTLQVGYGLAEYRYRSGDLTRKAFLPRAQRLLAARSDTGVSGDIFEPPPRPPVDPSRGHDTARLSVGSVVENGTMSLDLRIRPAYHDLLDPRGGYKAGGEVMFADLDLRYAPSRNKLRFHHFTAIDVRSIAPRTPLYKPLSWQVQTGVRRAPAQPLFDGDGGDPVFYLQGGPGLAYGRLSRVTVYGFALGSLDAGPGLHRDVRPGAGLAFGLLGHAMRGLNFKATVSGLAFPGARDKRQLRASVGGQWQITQNNGVRVTIRFTDTQRFDYFTTEVSWRWYF